MGEEECVEEARLRPDGRGRRLGASSWGVSCVCRGGEEGGRHSTAVPRTR